MIEALLDLECAELAFESLKVPQNHLAINTTCAHFVITPRIALEPNNLLDRILVNGILL